MPEKDPHDENLVEAQENIHRIDEANTLRSSTVNKLYDALAAQESTSDIPDQLWLKEVIPAAQESVMHNAKYTKSILQDCKQQLDNNTETRRLFTEIIANRNYEVLTEKSAHQAAALHDTYFGQAPRWNLPARMSLRKTLRVFEEWVQAMQVVRADSNGNQYDELRPPRQTGNISSFGCYDVPVQSDRYVYASLSGMPHYMARGSESVLRVWGQNKEPELLMQDVSNLAARYPDTWLTAYLNNMFDEQNGKTILALYLAYVFSSVEEAEQYLNANSHPRYAQQWDQEELIREISPNIPKERSAKIRQRMIEIAHKLGIEPSLSQEVRIPGNVTVEQ